MFNRVDSIFLPRFHPFNFFHWSSKLFLQEYTNFLVFFHFNFVIIWYFDCCCKLFLNFNHLLFYLFLIFNSLLCLAFLIFYHLLKEWMHSVIFRISLAINLEFYNFEIINNWFVILFIFLPHLPKEFFPLYKVYLYLLS